MKIVNIFFVCVTLCTRCTIFTEGRGGKPVLTISSSKVKIQIRTLFVLTITNLTWTIQSELTYRTDRHITQLTDCDESQLPVSTLTPPLCVWVCVCQSITFLEPTLFLSLYFSQPHTVCLCALLIIYPPTSYMQTVT